MLDNVRPTPHVRPPGGGSLSLLVRRIVATADLECYSMIREKNEEATNQWKQILMKSQKVVFD